jgi:hypothetical protein
MPSRANSGGGCGQLLSTHSQGASGRVHRCAASQAGTGRRGADRDQPLAGARPARARFYRKPASQTCFDLRQLKDGSVYEIIDNVFTPGQLAAIFAGRCENYHFHAGAKFDWITYVVK